MSGIRRLGAGREHVMEIGSGGATGGASWREMAKECEAPKPEISRTLKNTIEGEIIPRLMMAHSENARTVAPRYSRGWQITPNAIDEFVSIIIDHDDAAAFDFIFGLRDQGAPIENIYLQLLAPSARRLGDMWNEDKCHFVDVTIGLVRIQALLRSLSPDFKAEGEVAPNGSKALFSVHGAEQHTCGLFMVGEFFRRDGWAVWCGPPSTENEICDLVSAESFTLAGFSLSCEGLTEPLREEIARVRQASKNRDLKIFVGGQVFLNNTGLIGHVGADAFASDSVDAVLSARKTLEIGASS